jgi:hypothetical protein
MMDCNSSRVEEGGSALLSFNFFLTNCPASNLPPEVKKLLIVPLDFYFCMDLNLNLPLWNVYGMADANYLRVQVLPCQNRTENNNSCYSYDHTYEKYKSEVFNMHYVIQDRLLNGHNYSNPDSVTYSSGIIKSTLNTVTRMFFWYKNIDYFTDIGFILQDFENRKITQLDRAELQIIPTTNATEIYSHIITMSPQKDNYYRSYIKIQGVFAYIGGFISLFYSFFSYINEFINRPQLVTRFIDQYFYTKTVPHLYEKNHVWNNTPESVIRIYSSKVDIFNKQALPIKKQFSKKFDKKQNKVMNIISLNRELSFCDIIFRECRCMSNKKKIGIYRKIECIYRKKVSLEKLARLDKNVKMIKFLCFTEYQKYLLKYLNIFGKDINPQNGKNPFIKVLENKKFDKFSNNYIKLESAIKQSQASYIDRVLFDALSSNIKY